MKKPLAITPAAKAGFENGFGMKFGQPRLVHVLTADDGFLLLKLKHRNRRAVGLSSTVAERQR
ncbi:hypothetical protein WHZ77_16390 [Bradyrhizobium sp. A5]|uniref:hypothetical protein n=1 Tax=Bradyrhizobium sp. A5 TaxID=3133696 RepID=UPI00324DB117